MFYPLRVINARVFERTNSPNQGIVVERRSTFLRIVSALIVLIATLSAAPPALADHGGDHPKWECNGTPILMRGGEFYWIVPDPSAPGQLTVDPFPDTSGLANSTAYDPTTDYVYGVTKVDGTPVVRAYDANGDTVFDTPIQAPYPAAAGQYAGTVLGDGRYIIHSVGSNDGVTGWYAGARYNIWSIDPATGAATHIGSTSRNLADLSYNPLDGFVYHIVNRVLYKVNPNSGAVTTTSLPGTFPNGGFGSSWFDAAGFLYVFRNNPGDIFRVDINDPTIWSEVGEVGADGGTDGTSCVSQIDIKKDVVDGAGEPVVLDDRTYGPGDVVTYAYTLLNNGLPTMGLTTDLCDVLPGAFTYTGTWSSSHPSASLSSGGTAGDGDFCLEVEVPSSLWTDPDTPGEDPVVITFDVQIPADTLPGEYENQATLDYNQDGEIDLLSDDPGDGSEPRDPTTIQVTGEFTVSKSVDGHPDGPDTDSFTMNVVCTAADGPTITIDSTDIVDAITGSSWPGAGAGTFSIADGETVRIENLPADATCVTTETVPASYAAGPASSDGTTGLNEATVVIDEAPGSEGVRFSNQTGVLTITKRTSVTSDYPLTDDDTFTFAVVCDNGFNDSYNITTSGGSGSLSYPDIDLLPDGASCTVTETPPNGWTNLAADPVTVEISSDGPVTAEFRNSRQYSDLTINKTILGLPSGADPDEFTFNVSVECTGGFDPDPFTIPGSLTVSTAAPLVVEDLPVGAACTVTEAVVGGFVTSYTPNQTVTIVEGGSTVDITNSTGSLIVQKETEVVSDLPVDLVDTFDYQITCVQGTSTVYDNTHSLTTDTPTATGTIGGISWGDLPLIPNGSDCSVTELPTTGWTLVSPADGATIDLTVTPTNPEPTAEFTNRRDVASLTVTKTIDGAPAEWDLDDEEFTVTVTCSGDFDPSPVVLASQTVTAADDLVVDGVPTGSTCEVDENADSRFVASYSPTTPVTVDDDGETISITNTTSTVAITKTTVSTSSLDLVIDDTFSFTVVCDVGGDTVFDGTASITTSGGTGAAATLDLPLVAPGAVCTIREQGPPNGWSISERSGGTLDGDDGVVLTTVAGGNPVGFTNDRNLDTLTITKDVAGIPIDDGTAAGVADDMFTVNVVCSGPFTAGTVSFGPLNVSESSPAVITDLPEGANCTVTETADDRFTTSYAPNQTVAIVDSPEPGENQVDIVNTTTTVSVVKDTTTAAGIEDDATFSFSIECQNPSGDDIYSDTFSITTVDGTGTWESPATPLLPVGATCDVSELAPPPGWSLVSESPITVTTDASETVEATFENARSVADLTITKTLIGIPDGLDFDDEVFLVDVSCTGGLDPDPLVLNDQPLSKNVPLVIEDLPTGAVCTISEDFDSRFQTLYSPDIGDGTASQVTIDDDGTAAGITNAGGALIIRKSTVVDSDHPVDLLRDFDYELDCGTSADGTYTLNVEDIAGEEGIGGLTYTELPIIPSGTTCTITEVVPDGWSVNNSSVEVTISATGDPQTASFTNTRQTNDLTVSKNLVGVPSEVDLGNEEFVVDISCTDGFTVSPYVLQDQIITANAELVIEDLPVGATCSVVEEPDLRFNTSYSPEAPVVIDSDGETITVTNSTSTFSIVKSTTAEQTHPIIADDTFTFDIECVHPDSSVIYANTISIATSTGTGQWASPDSPLLPPGTTCSVSEQTNTGWSAVGEVDLEVTTSEVEAVTASFSNVRDVADLTITKAIVGLPDGVNLDDLSFPVTVTCTGDFTTGTHVVGPLALSVDEPIVIENLPTGASCEAAETTDTRFAAVYDPDDATVVIEPGGSSLGIDNVTGTFVLDKTILVDSSQPVDLTATFEFDVLCTNGASFVLTINSVDGVVTPLAYPDVPLVADGAACTISERTPPDGWTIVGDASQETIITFTESPTITFTNRRITSDLTITKSVLGAPSGLDPDDLTFTVDVSCEGDFDSSPLVFTDLPVTTATPITIPELPIGSTCDFVEDADPRFAATYSPAATDGASGQVTVVEGGVSGAIVNSTGEIMIVKVAETETGHPVDLVDTFVFNVSCGATYTATHSITTSSVLSPTSTTGQLRYDDLPTLPNGTVCTVQEATPPTGWTLTSPPSVEVVVDSSLTGDDVPTATFTNRRDTGPVTVVKELAGVPSAVDLDSEEFVVDMTCTGDFTTGSHTIEDVIISVDTSGLVDQLPTGSTCSVVEDPDPRFAVAYSDDVVVDIDGEALTVTNTTSTLTIDKTTVGPDTHPLDLDDTFTWDVVCIAPDDSTVFDDEVTLTTVDGAAQWVAPDTPLVVPGTECEVTEHSATGWTLSSANPQSITTASDSVAGAAFVNERDVGSLTVTKTLVGVPDDIDLTSELFPVELVCVGSFTGGELVEEVTVSAIGPVTIDDLPTGSTCLATEDDDARFATTYQPETASATIAGEPQQIEIVNSTGTIEIHKITSALSDLPVDVTGDFSFSTVCDNGTSLTHDVTVDSILESPVGPPPPGMVSHFGATIPWSEVGLHPTGTTCVVSEVDVPTGWSVTGEDAVDITLEAGVMTATFENLRDTETLSITKSLEGVPEGTDLDDERFDVTVTCVGSFEDGAVELTGEVSVNDALTIDGVPTSAICEVNEAEDLRFTASYLPSEASVEIDSDGGQLEIINRTSTLAITKSVVIDSSLMTAPNGVFEFELSCDNGLETVVEVVVAEATSDGGLGYTTYPDIPLIGDGVTCAVTERETPGWDIVGSGVATGELETGAVTELGFVNERQTVTLNIEKILVDAPDSFNDQTFPVSVECEGDFADGSLLLADEVGQSQSVAVTGIPTGSSCTVSETPGSGFTDSYSHEGGVVVLGHRESALITNTTTSSAEPAVALRITNTFDISLLANRAGTETDSEGSGGQGVAGTLRGLAQTGIESYSMIGFGLVLVLAGIATTFTSRKRRSRS